MRIFELAQLFRFKPEEIIQTLQSMGLERYAKQSIGPMTDLDDQARLMVQERLLGHLLHKANRTVDGLLVTGFKAFGLAQNQSPIRPLTIVFGPNSSGKSSLLHSLLFTHHNLQTSEGDVRQPLLGGESVDLGGFEQLCFRHNIDLGPSLTLTFKGTAIQGLFWVGETPQPVRISLLFSDPKRKSLAQKYQDLASDPERYIPSPRHQPNPWLNLFSCFVGEIELLRFSRIPSGKMRVDLVRLDHPFFDRIVDQISNSLRFSTARVSTDIKKDIREEFSRSLVESLVEEERYLPKSLLLNNRIFDENAFSHLTNLSDDERRQLPAALVGGTRTINTVLECIHQKTKDYFESLAYLGPLRSYPERYFSFAAKRDANWQAGGGWAWDVLRENEEIREKVNQWLGDPKKLNTPYRIGLRRYVDPRSATEDLEEVIWDIPNSLIGEMENANIDEMKTIIDQTTYVDVREKVEECIRVQLTSDKVNGINDLQMRDLRTDTLVSQRDVGVGISQVLPVLVMAFASSHKTLMIEQPEIHIHPKLQAELADVFIESALGPQKNTFIVETHSELIIQRMLKRIRETHTGQVTEGLHLRQTDVALLYVKPTPEGSLIEEIRIDEKGRLLDSIPGGFFEESFNEQFS